MGRHQNHQTLLTLHRHFPNETFLLYEYLYAKRLTVEDSVLEPGRYEELNAEINKGLIEHIARFPDDAREVAIEFSEKVIIEDLEMEYSYNQ